MSSPAIAEITKLQNNVVDNLVRLLTFIQLRRSNITRDRWADMKGKTSASSPVLTANSEQQNEASRIQGSTEMHSQFIASTSDLELVSSLYNRTKLDSFKQNYIYSTPITK